jgi:hypothetical protein
MIKEINNLCDLIFILGSYSLFFVFLNYLRLLILLILFYLKHMNDVIQLFLISI